MRTTPILSGFQLVLICLLMFGQLHPAFADPIHDGAARGDVQAIEQALATGADINKRDDKGSAALHAESLLLMHGAATDVQMLDGS
ncbi:MAG: hypothetical protein ACPH66_09265, partial [Candidatus Puniceispirillaceae bacterium]